MSLIDDYSAREIIEILHLKGIIELPFFSNDAIEITSCPVSETYVRNCPEHTYALTDYDTPDDDNIPVLHPHPEHTTRIVLSLTPKGGD